VVLILGGFLFIHTLRPLESLGDRQRALGDETKDLAVS